MYELCTFLASYAVQISFLLLPKFKILTNVSAKTVFRLKNHWRVRNWLSKNREIICIAWILWHDLLDYEYGLKRCRFDNYTPVRSSISRDRWMLIDERILTCINAVQQNMFIRNWLWGDLSMINCTLQIQIPGNWNQRICQFICVNKELEEWPF